MIIKKTTLNNLFTVSAVVIVVLLLGIALLGQGSSGTPTGTATIDASGKQILDLTAKVGYSPSVITAKANIESILRIKTSNTFDCSTALRIAQLNVTKNLPANGNTDITIAAQAPGTEIKGTCSMGMYNFTIKFT